MEKKHSRSLVHAYCSTSDDEEDTSSKHPNEEVMATKRISWDEYKASDTRPRISDDETRIINTCEDLDGWPIFSHHKSGPLGNDEIQQALFSPDNQQHDAYSWKNKPSKEGYSSISSNSDEMVKTYGGKKCVAPREEPVILTISSDEEDPSQTLISTNRICFKEPIILPSMELSKSIKLQERTYGTLVTSLICHLVRIGTFEATPSSKVSLYKHSIEFSVISLNKDGSTICIQIPLNGILKMLCHYEPHSSSFVIYVHPIIAANIRKQMGMEDDNKGFYFDPSSTEQPQKRLVFSLQIITVAEQEKIESAFKEVHCDNGDPWLEELDIIECEDMLIQSSVPKVKSTLQNSSTSSCETLLIYPPPPSKGRISITIDDYACLADEEFLNDVIIDFYLKWLHIDKLPEVHRTRTHVFSTFFYKRLTAMPKKIHHTDANEKSPRPSPAKRRHARVRSWTKGINIFEKDFIIIPINERSHWFLAVICYPGLVQHVGVSSSSPGLSRSINKQGRQSKREKNQPLPFILGDPDWSDKDEAESEEELNGFENVVEEIFPWKSRTQDCFKAKEFVHPVKKPCILIFDSLAGTSLARIVATLREYLTVEYGHKNNSKRKYTTENIAGAIPMVPQQMNYSDCGVYTLQFAESFFENPIKDYQLPIRSLRHWFSQEMVINKREAIAELIKTLMDPKCRIPIPELKFPFKESPPTAMDDSKNMAAASGDPNVELQVNEFHPINTAFQNKKINLNLSSKSLAKEKLSGNEGRSVFASRAETSEAAPVIQSSIASFLTKNSECCDEELYDDLPENDNHTASMSAAEDESVCKKHKPNDHSPTTDDDDFSLIISTGSTPDPSIVEWCSSHILFPDAVKCTIGTTETTDIDNKYMKQTGAHSSTLSPRTSIHQLSKFDGKTYSPANSRKQFNCQR